MVEEAEIKPHGIKRSILAKLQNAEQHFGKAQTFREAGKDKQAEHHENKGHEKTGEAHWLHRRRRAA